jgi:4-hydroxybenzoate polyprenyltransferase
MLFITCSYFINHLCFLLSPIALFIVLGYSYTKRFTSFCHFVLGLGLSLAPIGAYLAVTNRFDLIPLMYSLAVLLWVSGFDIIYALQDEEFDKSLGLNSIPTLLGKSQALLISRFIHGFCAITMIVASILVEKKYDNISFIHFIGLILFLSMLFYQHTLVSSNDLSKINFAFFTTNGIASVFFGSAFVLDFLW